MESFITFGLVHKEKQIQMSEQMYKQTDDQMSEQMYKQTDDQMSEQMYKQTDDQMSEQMYKQTDDQMSEQMYKQTDDHMNEQTNNTKTISLCFLLGIKIHAKQNSTEPNKRVWPPLFFTLVLIGKDK